MVDDYKRDGKKKVQRMSKIVAIADELTNRTLKSIWKKTSLENPCYPTSSDTAYLVQY